MSVEQMQFEWGYPLAFTLLVLPFLVYWLMPPHKKRRSALITKSYHLLSDEGSVAPTASAWISRRNFFHWFVLYVSWCLMVAAMASPQLVGQPEKKIKTARSFLIVSDLSFSMDTRDWVRDGERASRWEATKLMLKEFMQTRQSDRVGLIFFGTHPYLQSPLTEDHEVINWMLDETEVGMAGQTTGIGAAIGMGMKILNADTMEQKVMLLLTDGVDSGSDIAPLDAASLARKDSISIYTLGIGDPEAPGADLDEATLKAIAETTGARYFRAIDQAQMEEAYATLSELEPIEYESEEYQPKMVLHHYPLIAGILLIMLSQIVVLLLKFKTAAVA